jgi:adenine-specific DNA-methyltransferase
MPKNINLASEDIKSDRIETLKQLFPEIVSENQIDWEKLRKALGEDLEINGEKFNFTWAGKSKAIKTILEPSKATLKPAKEESIKFDESENLFIEGDNLEVLKLLQKAYFEKVKMIYIDPPYNTGGDFVYKDNFKSPIENYLNQTGQKNGDGDKLTTNAETNGRFHSDWLNMMFPRLKLAWNLLRDDGVIFISIDDTESQNLKQILNEIFGEENFVSDLTVVNNLKGRNDKKYIATANERLFMYSKSSTFEEIGLDLPEERLGEFLEEDEIGKYRPLGLRKRGGADTRIKRPRMFFPIYIDPNSGNVSLQKDNTYSISVLPLKSDQVEGCWRWGKDTVNLRLSSLIGKQSQTTQKWDIFEKDYLEQNGEIRKIKPKSIMYSKLYSTDYATKNIRKIFPEGLVFNNPKPVPFIKDLVQYSTLKDDTIMDFFAGSGTTAQAIIEQNNQDEGKRKFILIQLPESTPKDGEARKAGFNTIADITKERIRRVVKGYGDNPQPIDTGFKVFKLAKSNYPENNFEYDPEKTDEENQNAFKLYLTKAGQMELLESTNDLDVVYENIVKEGLSLNSKIEKQQFGSNTVYKITDGEQTLDICLEPSIKPDTVKILTSPEYKNKVFICRDSAVDDSAKANLSLNLELKTI